VNDVDLKEIEGLESEKVNKISIHGGHKGSLKVHP